MIAVGTQLTLEEFLALPEGDVVYELIDSHAVPKMSPKLFHSVLQSAFWVLIGAWCKGRGRVVQEWAVVSKLNGQDWVPVPDVTYISYDRLASSWMRNEACPVSPELVIEIISPGQTIKYFQDKAKDYLSAGVSRVWVVDPEAQSITVFFAAESSQCYTNTTPIVDNLLPGLELNARQVFEAAELI